MADSETRRTTARTTWNAVTVRARDWGMDDQTTLGEFMERLRVELVAEQGFVDLPTRNDR